MDGIELTAATVTDASLELRPGCNRKTGRRDTGQDGRPKRHPLLEESTTGLSDEEPTMESVNRMDRILTILSTAPPEGEPLRRVAKAAGLPLSSTHRLLQSFLDRGYAVQDQGTGYYRLGSRILQLASSYLAQVGFVNMIDSYLKELCAATGRQVTAYILEGATVVCIAIEAPTQTSNFYARVGGILPLHASAGAKALIYHLPSADLEGILEDALQVSYTKHTRRSMKDVLDDLERGRSLGYWECIEELEDGVCAVASPIVDKDRKPVVSFTITCLEPHFRSSKAELVDELLSVSEKASAEVGELLSRVHR